MQKVRITANFEIPMKEVKKLPQSVQTELLALGLRTRLSDMTAGLRDPAEKENHRRIIWDKMTKRP